MSYEVTEQGIVKKSEMKDVFSNGGAYSQPKVSENAYIVNNVNRGVNSCEMVPGSLMKAFSGQYDLSKTLVVQVLSVQHEKLQISDGHHQIGNCFAACNIDNLKLLTNPFIRITKWSLVKMFKTNKEDIKTEKSQSTKPEYGLKIESYSLLEYKSAMPVVGYPKTIRVTIIENPEIRSTVIMLLKHIVIPRRNQTFSEAFQFWVNTVCKYILKKGCSFSCGICGNAFPGEITAFAVSHILKHLGAPNFKCPKSGCIVSDLEKFQVHLKANTCNVQDMKGMGRFKDWESKPTELSQDKLKSNVGYSNSIVGIKAGGGTDAPVSLKSSIKRDKVNVKKIKPCKLTKKIPIGKQTVENVADILKTFDSHYMQSELKDDFDQEFDMWKDFDHTFNDDSEILSEYSVKDVNETVSENKIPIQFSDTENVKISKDGLSDPVNIHEELDNLVSLEELMSKEDTYEFQNDINPYPDITYDKQFLSSNKVIPRDPLELIPNQVVNSEPPRKKARSTAVELPQENFDWQKHVLNKISYIGKSMKCLNCGFRTGGRNIMISHFEEAHLSNYSVINCSHCASVCDSFLTYHEHMKIAHKTKLSLQQTNQQERILNQETSYSFINDAVEIVSGSEDEPFVWLEVIRNNVTRFKDVLTCKTCMLKIRDGMKGQKDMISHVETKHMKDFLGYRCPECSYLFKSFVSFNQHLNVTHQIHMNLLKSDSLFNGSCVV